MPYAYATVKIPQPLYDHLEHAAVRLQKPVQDLLAETLQAALQPALQTESELPVALQYDIASLSYLNEAELRDVAESEMSVNDQQRFDLLLDLQGMRHLTDEEVVHLQSLRAEYGRILLRKARAFALLAERGQPLSIE